MDVYSNTFITDQLEFMAATATDREVARCGLTRGDVIITKDSEEHDDIGVPALIRHDVANLVCGYHLAILRPRPARVVGRYLVFDARHPGATTILLPLRATSNYSWDTLGGRLPLYIIPCALGINYDHPP